MRPPLPSPATVLAITALFVALGGSAIALKGKNSVDSGDIKNGNVKGKDLANDAVDTPDIKGDAVKGAQIAAGAVGSAQIGDGSIAVGDLAPAAQPDKDLDLLRGQRVEVDDPPGAPPTTTTLLASGPFAVTATCQDDGGSVQIRFHLSSAEHGWVNTSSASPDDFDAGETVQLTGGNGFVQANQTATGGGYAITDSGRFMSFAAIGVGKPAAGTDCAIQASGWGG